jgi:hypothetical protein
VPDPPSSALQAPIRLAENTTMLHALTVFIAAKPNRIGCSTKVALLARRGLPPYPQLRTEDAPMTQRNATLVVIEFGGSWPRWLEPSRAGEMAVVAQHYEGEPASLVTQVASRITRFDGSDWDLATVIIVANARTDAEAFAARAVLARGLLARLVRGGGGELILTVDEKAGARACQEISGLAAALDIDAVGTGVRVSVRVGRGEPLFGLSNDDALLEPVAS